MALKIKKEFMCLNKENLIKKAKENAINNIKELGGISYLCVFKALYDMLETDIPYEAVKLLTGFTLGVGLSGNICAALLSGIAVLGLVYGRVSPMGDLEKRKFRDIVKNETLSAKDKARLLLSMSKELFIYNQLVNRFKRKFGSLLCSDLWSDWKENPICIARFKRCHEIIVETAGMTMELLLDANEKGLTSLPVGDTVYSYLFAE